MSNKFEKIDGKDIVRDFVRNVEQGEDRLFANSLAGIEDGDLDFSGEDTFFLELSNLRKYVEANVLKVDNEYSPFFRQNRFNTLMKKIYSFKNNPNLSEYELEEVNNLLEYVRDYIYDYDELFSKMSDEVLDEINRKSKGRR